MKPQDEPASESPRRTSRSNRVSGIGTKSCFHRFSLDLLRISGRFFFHHSTFVGLMRPLKRTLMEWVAADDSSSAETQDPTAWRPSGQVRAAFAGVRENTGATPMRRDGPVSISALVRPIIVVALLAIVCVAALCHEWRRRAADQDIFVQKVELVAEGAARSLASAKDWNADAAREACARLTDSRSIVAAALFDSAGRAIAIASRMEETGDRPLISGLPAFQSDGLLIENSTAVAPSDSPSARFSRAFVRLPGQPNRPHHTLGLVVCLDTPSLSAAADIGQFYLPLACVAIGAIYVADLRIRKRLIEPIQRLAYSDDCESSACLAADIQAGGAPLLEFSAIAARFDALRSEARIWQQKAEHIERRVDNHVARETKRIMRDLNQVRREVWRDPLTGVNNRRFLEEKFVEIFDAQKAAGRDLSVVMIDLDNFKLLNDTKGHAAGDNVLRFVGELLTQCLRADDCAVRYGGDEFIAILPGLSAEKAQPLVQRLFLLFNQRLKSMFSGEDAPTMTAGIASILKHEPEDAGELLACADYALLKAKRAGKRRAIVAEMSCPSLRLAFGPGRIRLHTSTSSAANL